VVWGGFAAQRGQARSPQQTRHHKKSATKLAAQRRVV